MAEQEKYYAVERLAELKAAVLRQSKAMVVNRAKVEKYREADIAAAKDCYLELKKTKTALEKAIFDARLLLMEVEEYELAGLAGKLSRGLAGFDLMSTNYKSVYDVLQSFALLIPAGDTVNAKVVGRLMNQIKLGYYPTDPANIDLMLRGITFPDGMTTNLLDPCCGCGKALRQFAQGNNCYTYDNLAYDSDVDAAAYCRRAEELFELYQTCANRKQIETICLNFVRSLEATKMSVNGHLYFVPRHSMEKVDIFEDFIEALSSLNKTKSQEGDRGIPGARGLSHQERQPKPRHHGALGHEDRRPGGEEASL